MSGHFTQIDGVDIPHFYGEFDRERAEADLDNIHDEPGLVIELSAEFFPTQERAVRKELGDIMAADRGSKAGFTRKDYSFHMLRGLVIARKQQKFDQLSLVAIRYPLQIDPNVFRQSDRNIEDELCMHIGARCYAYANAVEDFMDHHADVVRDAPTVWLGFGLAYVIGGRQAQLDDQASGGEV